MVACSIKWNFQSKLNMTMAAPFVAISLIQLYKLISVRWFEKTHDNAQTMVLTANTALFQLTTVFYLKTTLAAWDCSMNQDGHAYLDAQPSIRCDQDWQDPETGERVYEKILRQSTIGMSLYLYAFFRLLRGIFGFQMLTFCQDLAPGTAKDSVDRGGAARHPISVMKGLLVLDLEKGRQRFAFFASKTRNRWYWWELVILLRKVLLVVISMFNTVAVERGWWAMSFVQLIAIVVHLMVMPYRDLLINLYESHCLLSNFIVLQSSMAFTSKNSTQLARCRSIYPRSTIG